MTIPLAQEVLASNHHYFARPVITTNARWALHIRGKTRWWFLATSAPTLGLQNGALGFLAIKGYFLLFYPTLFILHSFLE
jgi:hypothetical protein